MAVKKKLDDLLIAETGGGAATIADGADVAQGAKADAAWSGQASGSSIAILKAIAAIVAPASRTSGLLTTNICVLPIPAGAKVVKVYASVLAKVGVSATPSVGSSVSEQMTITGGDATSGGWRATFEGVQSDVSTPILWNTTAAQLVAILTAAAMTSIGPAGVTAIGGPLNTTPIVVTFANNIIDGDHLVMTAASIDLAGGASGPSMLPTIAITTHGSNVQGFVEAGTEMIFQIPTGMNDLYVRAVSTTGLYRVTWFA